MCLLYYLNEIRNNYFMLEIFAMFYLYIKKQIYVNIVAKLNIYMRVIAVIFMQLCFNL